MNRSEVLKKQIQLYSYAISSIIFLCLGKLIGNTGLAYIAIGLETVSFFMILCSDSLADVLCRMIRYRRKRKQFQDALVVRKRIFIIGFIISVLLLACIFIFADSIAEKIFHLSRAALLIRILVPIILLRSLENCYIGYLQSFGKYLNISIFTLLRQIFFWIFAGGIVKSRIAYGDKVADLLKNEEYVGMYGAVGVAIAMLIAEVLIFLALFIYYIFSNREYDRANMERNLHKYETVVTTYREFILLNGSGFYMSLLKQILILLPLLLISDTQIRGIWYGKYVMILSIPIYMMIARLFFFQQGLYGIVRNRDMRMSREYIQTGMKYTWSVGLFISLLLAVLAPQIVGAYFPEDTLLLSCLRYGGILILLLTMIIFFVMVHLAHHRKLECFVALAVTAILFILVNRSMYIKMQKPEAIIYASCISLAIGMLVLGALTIFQYGVHTEYITVFVLPILCVGVTCLIILMVEKAMTPHVGNQIGGIVGAVLGFVLFIGSLSYCRIFDETDINRLYGPIGRKILSFVFR